MCKGDVVLFRQKVYQKCCSLGSSFLVFFAMKILFLGPCYYFLSGWFNLHRFHKASKRGRCAGKRTVAGRVVKESYGATKQQHTFTVRPRLFKFSINMWLYLHL